MLRLKKHFFSTASSKGMEKREKSIFYYFRNARGVSLIGLIATMGALPFVLLGLLQLNDLSSRITSKAMAGIGIQDLHASILDILRTEQHCKGSFKPLIGRLEGANSANKYTGEVKKLSTYTGTTQPYTENYKVLESGEVFKSSLHIVKMELKKVPGDSSTASPTVSTTSPISDPVTRRFVVYYKKEGLGKGIAGKDCDATSANINNCYYEYCDFKYKLNAGGTAVETCESPTCGGIIQASGGTGGSVDCYTEYQSGPDKAIYVGCGTTKGNTDVSTTAYGLNAGNSGAGGKNTFIGRNAGRDTTSIRNTFVGNNAGRKTTTGFENVFIGYQAGKENLKDDTATTRTHEIEASRNTFIGAYAGENNTSGRNHVFIGELAGQNSEGGQSNTFVGPSAGRANSGSENTFIGVQTGMANTTTNGNTFIGAYAGNKNTGGNHVFIGAGAGADNVSASNNTFVGHNAGNKTTAGDNVFIGREAGFGNTTGAKNLFIGYQAGKGRWTNDATSKPVTGRNNIAIGNEAGVNLTNGRGNTFIGNKAGNKTEGGTGQQGIQNIFIGNVAGEKNTTGAKNVFIGVSAGKETTSGNRNIFIGDTAGRDNTASGFNVIIGPLAGQSNRGSNNVIIGKEAGNVLNSGTDKTTPANNNIFIGHEASKTTAGGITETGSHQMNIGNLLFGTTPTGTPPTGADFFATNYKADSLTASEEGHFAINGNLYVKNKIYLNCGNTGTTCQQAVAPASSRVFKNNITLFKNYQYALSVINNTPLFTYYYNKDHPKHKRMGIISEDLPKHLQIQDNGKPIQPDWVSIYGTLWAGIKALYNRFMDFKKEVLDKIHKLKITILDIGKRLEALEKENKALKKENIFFKEQIKSLNKTGVSK